MVGSHFSLQIVQTLKCMTTRGFEVFWSDFYLVNNTLGIFFVKYWASRKILMLPWLRKDKGHLISWAILLQLIFYTWCYPSKRAANFSRVLFNNTFMIPPSLQNYRQRRGGSRSTMSKLQVCVTCEKFLSIAVSLIIKQTRSLFRLSSDVQQVHRIS